VFRELPEMNPVADAYGGISVADEVIRLFANRGHEAYFGEKSLKVPGLA
jgi:hypothetical protein